MILPPETAPPPPLAPEERRIRKEARREKQRAANVGRALKMHLARVAADPDAKPSGDDLPRINVGCSGWFYWYWRDHFYQGLPTKEWFPKYRNQFGTVELNASFYSWPTVNAVKIWQQQAGDSPFCYTVKVCELITHVKRFRATKTLIRDFGHIATLLGPRMGCFLFQLPPSYDFTAARLKSITEQLDPMHRNVLEFRHKSWWNPKVYDAFRACGIIFCSSSAPRLPDDLIRTADDIYLRFHGPKLWYRHDYSKEELNTWSAKVSASGCRRVWAYFNNDRDGCALTNARQYEALLQTTLARMG